MSSTGTDQFDPDAAPASAADVLLPARGDTTALRVMKIIVIVLGIALVLGFFTVIGRMVYLTSRTDASTETRRATASTAPAAGAAIESALTIPSGHEVRGVSLDGRLLAVHVVGPGGSAGAITVIDLGTGRTVNRIVLTPAPAPP